MAAHAASAATFDFVSMADNSSDDNYIGLTEINWSPTFTAGVTIGGVTLDASGTNVSGATADAFFDKGAAGLGVCSTALGCATGGGGDASDDNVQAGETLTLDFNQTVSIASMFFNDDGHVAFSGTVIVNATESLTIVNGFATALSLGALTVTSIYDFSTYSYMDAQDELVTSQFYIGQIDVAAVPLPAAGLLLLGALGGLGMLRRRRASGAQENNRT